MTRSAASLLVLVVVALQCIGSQGDYSGPCATLPSHNISTQTAFFAIDGTYVSFYAFNSTGVPITNSWIQFAFLGVQEWWTNFSVSVNRTCYEPDSYVPPPAVTPDPPHDPQQYQALMVADMMCTQTWINDTIPGTNIAITVLNTVMHHPVFNESVIVMNVTKSYGNHTIDFPPSNFTGGIPYREYFKTDSLKLSLQVDNFPWTGPPDSFLDVLQFTNGSMGYNMDLFYSDNLTRDDYELSIVAQSGQPNISFFAQINRGFLLQNDSGYVPYMNNIDHQQYFIMPPGGFPWLANTLFFGPLRKNNASMALCENRSPNLHYDSIRWDPSFTALFVGDAPPNAPAIISNNDIALKVALPIVLVICAAAVVFGIVYWKFKSVRLFFQPYKGSHGSSYREGRGASI